MSSIRVSTRAGALLACLSVASVLPAAAGQMGVDGRFERSLNVSGAVDLTVKSGSGSVVVRPGSGSTVQVLGKIRISDWRRTDDAAERVKRIEKAPPIAQNGNQVRIGDQDDEELYRGISISYEITVPKSTTATVGTGSGSIEIGALQGVVSAHSGSGSVKIDAVDGQVKVGTGSGAIEVAGAKGAEARTGSGQITLRSIAGSARANTGSGSITIEQTSAAPVEAHSASGSIKVTGARDALDADAASGTIHISGDPGKGWSLNTASGGVHLTVPAAAKFTVDAQTTSGSISVEHNVEASSTGRRYLKGSVNGGGPVLNLRTTSGSISIDQGK